MNGQILRDGVDARRGWVEYFEQVLNVEVVREANIVVGGRWMPVSGQFNERTILVEEVREAVNEMKSGRLLGLDGRKFMP